MSLNMNGRFICYIFIYWFEWLYDIFYKVSFKRLRVNSGLQSEFLFVYQHLLEIVLKQIALVLKFNNDDSQVFFLYVTSTYDLIITVYLFNKYFNLIYSMKYFKKMQYCTTSSICSYPDTEASFRCLNREKAVK